MSRLDNDLCSPHYSWEEYEALAPGELEPPSYLAGWPLIVQGLSDLKIDILLKEQAPSFVAAIKKALRQYLHSKVAIALGKVFVYEVNHRRVNGLLEGGTPEQRYSFFLKSLQNPEVIEELAANYPILYRRLSQFIFNTSNFVNTFVERLYKDSSALAEQFEFKISDIIQVILDKGDPHYGGKTTIELRSKTSGVMYKPRDMQADLLYQSALAAINDKLSMDHIPTISKKGYGWQQYIVDKKLESSAEISRYYYGLGVHLSLAYLLNLTDIHHENVLCDSNGTPYIVDLESIFNNIDLSHKNKEIENYTDAERRGARVLQSSVIQSGLLPLEFSQMGLFSGSAMEKEILTPVEVDTFSNINTDELKIERKKIFTKLNSPVKEAFERFGWSDEDTSVQIKQGFAQGYRAILSKRSTLKDIIVRYTPNSARYISRPTYMYMTFLNELSNPLAASDEEQFKSILNKLKTGEQLKPEWSLLCAQEEIDLNRMDIPAFYHDPKSKHLSGAEHQFEDFFLTTGISQVLNKLSALDIDDLTFQQYVIDSCFNTIESYKNPLGDIEDNQQYIDVLIEKIESTRLQYGEHVAWFGKVSHASLPIAIIEDSLYNGTSGLLLLLSMARPVGAYRSDYPDDTITLLLKTLKFKLQKSMLANEQGFFCGRHGVLWVLYHHALRHSDVETLDFVKQNLMLLKPDFDGKAVMDVLDGLSGMLLCITDLYVSGKDKCFCPIAHDIYTDIKQAFATGNFSLMKSEGNSVMLGGFSHGLSGIAHALATYGKTFGVEEAISAAKSFISREAERYDSEMSNWPDLRTGKPEFQIHWCNGAIGYLLVRAIHWDILTDKDKEQFNQTFAKVLNWYDETDDTLCHGRSGTLGVLQTIKLYRPELTAIIDKHIDVNLGHFKRKEYWQMGWSHHPQGTGFMVGLAGIAYYLLYLRDQTIPNPLAIMTSIDIKIGE